MLNDKILSEFREAYKDITSDKSWVKTLLLCAFGGCCGLHRFYTRKNKSAIIQLVLSISVIGLPISLIWTLYDLFQILYNNFTDSNDKILDRDITKKSVTLLTFFLGHLGFSDFYIKDNKKGLIKFLLFISCFGSVISFIWNLIDLHLIYLSEQNANKYSELKNNFDTKKCLLLLILYYLALGIIFCNLCPSQTPNFNGCFNFIQTIINNIWAGFVNIIKWILKMLFYCLCGILAIAVIIGSLNDSTKTNKKTTKEKTNNKYQYAIVSYQYKGQIFSFKIKDTYESNIGKTVWITDANGFNTQAKFLSIDKISFSDYNNSNLPDYRFKKDFYKK